MKPKHTNLEGKVAVVTGGGGVLCGSMARELAKHGMKIAILNYPKEFGDKTAEDINNAGGEAISVFCDVTKPDIVNQDRKSTRLNSSHVAISYAVFCLKKKTTS